jgi:hypothetical protein
MEKGAVKLIDFNGEDFGYWKNRTHNYLLSQGRAIWEIVEEAYVIPATLDPVTQGELQMYENNYKALNLITTALGRKVYDRVSHLKIAHEYCFARFESIVSSLRSCGPLAYSDNKHTKQLLYALDDSAWAMKITALEESADFITLDTEKLFSKLKCHELSKKGHPNHDASLTSKTFVTSTRVGGHVTNPTNTTDSSALEFALSFLSAASDE